MDLIERLPDPNIQPYPMPLHWPSFYARNRNEAQQHVTMERAALLENITAIADHLRLLLPNLYYHSPEVFGKFQFTPTADSDQALRKKGLVYLSELPYPADSEILQLDEKPLEKPPISQYVIAVSKNPSNLSVCKCEIAPTKKFISGKEDTMIFYLLTFGFFCQKPDWFDEPDSTSIGLGA